MFSLEELNDSQREAVLCVDAPSLVIAGAGSGKTRVLTYKVAYLLELGMQPWNILALTFTNKAAREMRERIAKLVSPEKAAALWMGTFHSIFAKILRIEGHRLGYNANYTIYDTDDSKSLIRLILKEMNLDDKIYKPNAVQNIISTAKNRLVLPSGYASVKAFREADSMYHRPQMAEVYSRYQERCKQANAMDFDDLLLNTWLIFKHNPEVAAAWQERFHFVLVDEYQDTNYAQHQIICLLTDRRQRVCVVGDDAQSIYSFRGAEIDNILHFCETYPDVRLFKLERNYRSTQTIVNAASSVIRNNRKQIPKEVYSEKEVGSPLAFFEANTDKEEADIVLREVQKAHRAGIPYQGIAVLYRTNAQSLLIEKSFRFGGVPYHIFAGMSFYQREEVKDMLCYLRLTANPYDEASLRRIINKPARGIGDTTVRKLFLAAAAAGTPVWEVLGAGNCPNLNAGALSRLQSFYEMIASFHESSATDDAYTLALRVVKESGLRDLVFSGHEPEDVSRQENLQEMLDDIGRFVRENDGQEGGRLLADYLQDASLATDFDRNNVDKDADEVNMMTIHAAKGLEFPVVIIAGMEDGLFPSESFPGKPVNMDEERRLFYVALTRAERQVVLTRAKTRFRNGNLLFPSRSLFVEEIPPQYFSGMRSSASAERTSQQSVRTTSRPSVPLPSLRPVASPAAPTRVPSGTPAPSPLNLSVGSVVFHERFGRGVVQAMQGKGLDAKATVAFDNAGTKVLMLRFAKLTVE